MAHFGQRGDLLADGDEKLEAQKSPKWIIHLKENIKL